MQLASHCAAVVPFERAERERILAKLSISHIQFPALVCTFVEWIATASAAMRLSRLLASPAGPMASCPSVRDDGPCSRSVARMRPASRRSTGYNPWACMSRLTIPPELPRVINRSPPAGSRHAYLSHAGAKRATNLEGKSC